MAESMTTSTGVCIREMQPEPGLVRSYSRELDFARIRFHCNHRHASEPVCMLARTTLSLRLSLLGLLRRHSAFRSNYDYLQMQIRVCMYVRIYIYIYM